MYSQTITTSRLLLRPLKPDDAEAVFERVASDPDVTRYMSWPTNRSANETREFVRNVTENHGSPPFGHVWAICVEGDPLPSGTIGVLPRATRLELGYVLQRSQWGRGLMTEACRALCDTMWANEDVWRIQAYCHVENDASTRVLEKCGFRREGLTRRMHVMPQISEAPQDCWLYARVRDDLE